MLISRKILQSYFDEELPDSSVISKALTMRAYEVEGVEKVAEDEVFDIDVLPNRASDSLSHIGVAREVGLALNMAPNFSNEEVVLEEKNPDEVDISIEDETASRFVAVAISGLKGGETPTWMSEALLALGERPINPIVDITNYVMLTTGQPLHAYDLDILENINSGQKTNLTAGFGKSGERLVLLDDTEIVLTGKELLIRTGDHPLGLAGVKGGAETRVTEKTTRILLESATFDARLVRRTAKIAKIQTGGSKRFENGTPEELVALGVQSAIELLREVYGEVEIEALRDLYPNPQKPTSITLDKNHSTKLLGVEVGEEEITKILEKTGSSVEAENDHLLVTPPWFRRDLGRDVDLVEEVARLYGLEKIESEELEAKAVTPERSTAAREVVRQTLIEFGYSEIVTRAFYKDGEVEVANPLATDAPFLRADMYKSTKDALDLNAQNAELLEIEYVRIFEISTVFKKDTEEVHLVVAIQKTKNARSKVNLSEEIEKIESALSGKLGIQIADFKVSNTSDQVSNITEYDLGRVIEQVDLMPTFEYVKPKFHTFEEFSAYPYVLRDVAIWTPGDTTASDIQEIIKRSANELLRVVTLFDRFEKEIDGEKRVSFAFRLVFQSFEKTLSDSEVNKEMDVIYSALLAGGNFEIR